MKRKLTEQVIYSGAFLKSYSAGGTSAVVSTSIDREGYQSAYVVAQALGGTGADTQTYSLYIYDSSDNSTFAIHDSANATSTVAPSLTTATATGFAIDLAAAKRYIRMYAVASGATTITATISMACILGDGVTEPAT